MIIALAVIGGIVLANTALAKEMIQYLRIKNTIYKKGEF